MATLKTGIRSEYSEMMYFGKLESQAAFMGETSHTAHACSPLGKAKSVAVTHRCAPSPISTTETYIHGFFIRFPART